MEPHGVVFLVADLAGSTALGERLDVEEVLLVVGGATMRMAEAVAAGGGTVEATGGDGLVARWQGRLAEVAEPAVTAGRTLLAGIADHARLVGVPLQGRAGLAAGVGTLDASSRIRKRAEMLEHAARPQTLLVDAEAAAAAGVDHAGTAPSVPLPVEAVELSAGTVTVPRVGEARAQAVRHVCAVFLITRPEVGAAERVAAIGDFVRHGNELGGLTKGDDRGGRALAVFGIQVAREDDAQRALRLALQVGTVGRVGIVTGRAAAGDLGPHLAVDVLGDTINSAARLADAAETILADDATVAFARGHARLGDRVHVSARGKQDPIAAHHVEGLKSVAHDVDRGLVIPVAGRARELAYLETLLVERPAVDQPALGLLIGAPGVGKSRLVQEVRIRHPRTRWHVGRCAEYASAWNLWPLQEPAASLLGLTRVPDSSAELAAIADSHEVAAAPLHAIFGLAPPEAVSESASAIAAQVADLLTSLLRRSSATAPTVVVVEDVHWADPDSRAVLELLSQQRSDHRASILLTSREQADTLAWIETKGAAIVTLDELGAVEDRQLVEAAIGVGTLPPELLDAVLRTGCGHPLLLVELLRSMVDEGHLRRVGPDAWEYSGPSTPVLPATVERVALSRLDRASEDVVRVVRAAAVIGDPAKVSDLAAIASMSPAEAVSAVATATASGLLSRDEEHVTVSHALIGDAALATTLRAQRADLHARAAEWAEATGAAARRIAHHWWEAGDRGRAVRWAVTAADDAEHRGAFIEAADQLEKVLAVGTGAAAGVATRVRLGHCRFRGGQLQVAQETFRAAVDEALHESRMDLAVEAAVAFEDARFASRAPREGPDEPSLAILRGVRDRLPARPTAPQATVLASLARAAFYAEGPEAGRTLASEARQLLTDDSDPTIQTRVLHTWRLVHAGPEWLLHRLAVAQELREAASAAEDPELMMEVLRLEVVDRLQAGDLDGAEQVIAQFVARLASWETPLYSWYPAMWEGALALAAADLDRAEDAIARFREIGYRCRYAGTELVYGSQLLLLRREQNRCVELEDLNRRLGHLDKTRNWTVPSVVFAHASGDPNTARATLRSHAHAGFDEIPATEARPGQLALLAEVAHALDEVDAAAGLEQHLQPWVGRHLVVGAGAMWLGSADRYLGLLADLRGDRPAAVRLLQDAADADCRARCWLAYGYDALHLERLDETWEPSPGVAKISTPNLNRLSATATP